MRIKVSPFWRLTLGIGMTIGLLTGGAILSARLSTLKTCLAVQSITLGGGPEKLVDVTRGQLMLDSRHAPSQFFWSSPDRQWLVELKFEGNRIDQNSLILYPLKNGHRLGSGKPIQTGLAGMIENAFLNKRLLWSPDSRHFAFLWKDLDQNPILSTLSLDTLLVQSTPLQPTGHLAVHFERLFLSTWSADSRLFMLGENEPSALSYTLWSAVTLQQVSQPFWRGVWSPGGSLFAGIRKQGNTSAELFVWSPDSEKNVSLSPSAEDVPELVTWSPQGSYIVIHRRQRCAAAEGCKWHWTYDVFDPQGTLVIGNIQGGEWNPVDTASPLIWSSDEQTLFFVQTRADSNAQASASKAISDYVSLRIADKRLDQIAVNLVSSLIQDMFVLKPYQQGISYSEVWSEPQGQHVILPLWQDGNIRIEVAELNGNHRFTLIDQAKAIWGTGGSRGYSRFWWYTGSTEQMVLVPWDDGSDTNQRVHLTWVNADGTNRHEIAGLRDISALQGIFLTDEWNDPWLGFIGDRNGKPGIEIVNIESGRSFRFLEGLTLSSQWTLIPSPSKTHMALMVTPSQIPGTAGSLYFVALQDGYVHRISDSALSYPAWSEDGARLAFLRDDSTQHTRYVDIVDDQGTALQTITVGRTNRDFIQLSGWSNCD